MSQPPSFPESSDPQSPHQPGGPQVPRVPRQGGQGMGPGGGRGPIPAVVGCGLLVLVLVLSIVAFFGVRAWLGDDDRGEQTSAPQEESPAEEEPSEESSTAEETSAEESAEESAEDETTAEESAEAEPTEAEPTEEEVAAGEANAVPQGTVVTLAGLDNYEGTVDISIGDVNWDAAEWVNEQNSHNPQPTDQGKYIMVQAELTYHGPGEFSSYAFMPVDYVAADGTPYEEAGVVTPDTTNRLTLQDGQSGIVHWVFMMPKDTPESGHFVLADALPLEEALEEGQWIEAA